MLAHIAQSVERVLGKNEVSGSNPDVGSMPDFCTTVGWERLRRTSGSSRFGCFGMKARLKRWLTFIDVQPTHFGNESFTRCGFL